MKLTDLLLTSVLGVALLMLAIVIGVNLAPDPAGLSASRGGVGPATLHRVIPGD